MKKYEVLVEDESANILNELLQSLSFVKEVKQVDGDDLHSTKSEIAFPYRIEAEDISPSKEAEIKGSLEDLFGIWKDRYIDLETIREQQWGRKEK